MASVIYLTDTRYGQRAWQHPSARHRCYHYADGILSLGGNAAVYPLERINSDVLDGFEHAIFHRPVLNKRFEHAVSCCRRAGLRLHADYDDLIFHPDFAGYSPQHIDGGKELGKIQRQFEDTFKAAKHFKSFLVSTAYLAGKIHQLFPAAICTVLPNGLPRIFHAPDSAGKHSTMPTVGYFPGSRGHGEDFKSISVVLEELLNTDVRLLIVGRMNQEDYKHLPNVKHIPFVNYTEYLRLLSLVDVSIAPLLDNEFNQSKSAVKLIESVSVGTPIVASKNQDMCDHDNELSWLVNGEQQWRSALQETTNITSADCRKSLVGDLQKRFSVNARLTVMQSHLEGVA